MRLASGRQPRPRPSHKQLNERGVEIEELEADVGKAKADAKRASAEADKPPNDAETTNA